MKSNPGPAQDALTIPHLRAFSKDSLNYGRLKAVTTSLGSLFQCLTTLWVRNFFPTILPTLPHTALSVSSSPVIGHREQRAASLMPLMRKLQPPVRSEFSFLFFRLKEPSDLSCLFYRLSSRPLAISWPFSGCSLIISYSYIDLPQTAPRT